jgi:large subunit ribosomal protein L19
MADLIKSLEAKPNPNVPDLQAGDTVRVHVRIIEGERERIQPFAGTVIRARKGGNDASFTVRRIASHGIGVERTFLLRSPRLERVEIVRRARVRRAQLYYLRHLRGKAARLKERVDRRRETPEAVVPEPAGGEE